MKSFRQVIQEAGGEAAGKIVVHKTPLDKARAYAEKEFQKIGKTLDEEVPNFDENYKLLQKKLAQSKGVRRVDMPVIDPEQIGDFVKHLDDGRIDIFKPYAEGKFVTQQELGKLEPGERWIDLGYKDGNKKDDVVKAKYTTVPVKDLKPIQEEVYFDKIVAPLVKFGKITQSGPVTKLTLITSSDNYIIDGHHRFSGMILSDPDLKASVVKVPLKIDDLLKVTLSYGDSVGNERNK
ncbi:MAG: hypothetical protein BV459_03950 [Thermoplasmata archaeon M11B2D]|nr:MAG: hypothetical protein BV459_03950 [Thermoplasmata archaeon M11B2D]